MSARTFGSSADEVCNFGSVFSEQFHSLLQPDQLIGLPLFDHSFDRNLLEVVGGAALLETFTRSRLAQLWHLWLDFLLFLVRGGLAALRLTGGRFAA